MTVGPPLQNQHAQTTKNNPRQPGLNPNSRREALSGPQLDEKTLNFLQTLPERERAAILSALSPEREVPTGITLKGKHIPVPYGLSRDKKRNYIRELLKLYSGQTQIDYRFDTAGQQFPNLRLRRRNEVKSDAKETSSMGELTDHTSVVTIDQYKKFIAQSFWVNYNPHYLTAEQIQANEGLQTPNLFENLSISAFTPSQFVGECKPIDAILNIGGNHFIETSLGNDASMLYRYGFICNLLREHSKIPIIVLSDETINRTNIQANKLYRNAPDYFFQTMQGVTVIKASFLDRFTEEYIKSRAYETDPIIAQLITMHRISRVYYLLIDQYFSKNTHLTEEEQIQDIELMHKYLKQTGIHALLEAYSLVVSGQDLKYPISDKVHSLEYLMSADLQQKINHEELLQSLCLYIRGLISYLNTNTDLKEKILKDLKKDSKIQRIFGTEPGSADNGWIQPPSNAILGDNPEIELVVFGMLIRHAEECERLMRLDKPPIDIFTFFKKKFGISREEIFQFASQGCSSVIVPEEVFRQSVKASERSHEFSETFEPVKEPPPLNNLPVQLVGQDGQKAKMGHISDVQALIDAGLKNSEQMRASITAESLGTPLHTFEVQYNEMGTRRFGVFDIKNLPTEIFEYCAEALYWGMQRIDVNRNLVSSATKDRDFQSNWLRSKINTDEKFPFFMIFDITDQHKINLVGHSSLNSSNIDGADMGLPTLAQAVYDPSYFGTQNGKKIIKNGSDGIGTHARKFVLDQAKKLGHQNVISWVQEGNIPSERILIKHGFRRTNTSKTSTKPDGSDTTAWLYEKEL